MRTIVIGFAFAAAMALGIAGCNGGSNSDSTPEQQVQKIAKNIKIGASSATALGLVAIPDEAQADQVAEEALRVMENNVLPLLQGDEGGLVDGFSRLRDLSVFDDKPELAKLKMILETTLPLLEKNLPDDLVDEGLEKVPADVRAYMTAFFTGVHDGLEAYLGHGDGLQGAGKYHELRKKLAE